MSHIIQIISFYSFFRPPPIYFILFHFILQNLVFVFFLKILFIYSTEITSRQRSRQREREEEAGSPLSREPDAGLDPRTLRS